MAKGSLTTILIMAMGIDKVSDDKGVASSEYPTVLNRLVTLFHDTRKKVVDENYRDTELSLPELDTLSDEECAQLKVKLSKVVSSIDKRLSKG